MSTLILIAAVFAIFELAIAALVILILSIRNLINAMADNLSLPSGSRYKGAEERVKAVACMV